MKKCQSSLPVIFILMILIVSILNIKNFSSIFVEKTRNIQVEQLKESLSSIEVSYAENFVAKENYVDINGGFSNLLGQVERNQRVKLKNGYLTEIMNIGYSNEIGTIQKINDINKYLELNNIRYLYVQTPYVILEDDNQEIPMGQETYVNANADRLLEGLSKNGVKYLDIREEIKREEIDPFTLYYKTDHHWTTEAIFWAHQHIVRNINTQLGIESEEKYFDISEYRVEVLPFYGLGSHGQRTGLYYAGVDKVTKIWPNFETSMKVEEPVNNLNVSGTFEDIFPTMESDKGEIRDYFSHIYLQNRNVEYRKITNYGSSNNLKILVLNDSFALPLVPFLALHYGEVHMYDIRDWVGGTPEGFIETIERVKPDIVIQIHENGFEITEEARSKIK